MTSFAVKLWLSVIVLLAGVYGMYTIFRVQEQAGAFSRSSAMRSTQLPAYAVDRELSDFTFTERTGKPLNLQAMEGKIWVASFFFADCMGACRLMNSEIAKLQEEFADSDVRFVSISVDPDRDTPQRLSEYAQTYGADPQRWLFLTGPLAEAQALGEGVFRISVQGMEHSDRLVLIDRQGMIRGTYSASETMKLEEFRRDLRKLLAEPPAATHDEESGNDSASHASPTPATTSAGATP